MFNGPAATVLEEETVSSPMFRTPSQEVGSARIAELLIAAATLVVHDQAAARLRLCDILTLLSAEEPEALRSGDIIRFLAPWQASRVRKFIDENLDGPIRIEALAEHTRLSISYFFRAFRGTFGVSPHAFVMQCRTDRAMVLLTDSNEPIAHIAIACGFSDQAHFSRVFARRAGMPPGAWRRLQRGAVSISA